MLYEHIKRAVSAGSDDATLNFALALDDPAALRRAFTTAFEAMQVRLFVCLCLAGRARRAHGSCALPH